MVSALNVLHLTHAIFLCSYHEEQDVLANTDVGVAVQLTKAAAYTIVYFMPSFKASKASKASKTSKTSKTSKASKASKAPKGKSSKMGKCSAAKRGRGERGRQRSLEDREALLPRPDKPLPSE
jgi:hypothetical protein